MSAPAVPVPAVPHVRVSGEDFVFTQGAVKARIGQQQVVFAHLGLQLLGEVGAPTWAVGRAWDALGPKRRAWRERGDPVARVTAALDRGLDAAALDAAELWDTMRLGDRTWRPGEALSALVQGLQAHREDLSELVLLRDEALCPSVELLQELRKGKLDFGAAAERYATALRAGGTLDRAAGAVVLALARRRLPVLLCTHPYVPDFTEGSLVLGDTPYPEWPVSPGCDRLGCHRVVLAAELARWFRVRGGRVKLLELDATFGGVKIRRG